MARRAAPNAKTRKPARIKYFGCTESETAALILFAAAFGQLTHLHPETAAREYFVPDEARFLRCPDCTAFLPDWPRCRKCGWREPGARWIIG